MARSKLRSSIEAAIESAMNGAFSKGLAISSCMFALAACSHEAEVAQAPRSRPQELAAPKQVGPVVADAFYPGFDPKHDKLPAPVDGGRVVVHLLSFPASLNYMIENSAVTRRMWNELHEGLLRQDMATWEYEPALAESYQSLDQIVLDGGDVRTGKDVLEGWGADLGERWRLVQRTGSVKDGPEIPKAKCKLLPGTVHEFTLRKGVHWQDGADFDARDVLFSMRCLKNRFVDCDDKRAQFDKIVRFESTDPHHVKFIFAEPYFLAKNLFEGLPILPAHLYDLSDERNPSKKAAASDEEQARFIAEHPANRMWVGLGPYRMVEWSENAIVAKRWDGYYDHANGGHVDEIVWRQIRDDGAALTALLEGQLDFYDRLSGDDYLGGRTEAKSFQERYYKGFSYGPQFTYIAWNTAREKLRDARVRTALGMCFDWDGFIAGYYKGLAERVTGEQFLHGPAYDATLAPLPFDLERARALLTEAGWYDRDGDGRVDLAGTPLSLELLYSAGSRSSELSGQAFQANLAKVGVELKLVAREWAAMQATIHERKYDAISMAWVTPPVVDPEQLWHSRTAVGQTANQSGLSDPEVDRWIEQIHVELDPARQKQLFANLQRRVYDLQPYVFGVNVPRKFAMSKRVRNLECFTLDPGYSIRRWYVTTK
ncbi:MAG TPA: ABC transporter substrate-binding protein [Planctomycetota bacterium]|nr:ABC transporter substrate-binding protein [Planctomycetota bacterium]